MRKNKNKNLIRATIEDKAWWLARKD